MAPRSSLRPSARRPRSMSASRPPYSRLPTPRVPLWDGKWTLMFLSAPQNPNPEKQPKHIHRGAPSFSSKERGGHPPTTGTPRSSTVLCRDHPPEQSREGGGGGR